MQIILQNAGKRFNRDWIFRHANMVFESGQSYAITGPNGSGKSTLLQVAAGALQPNEGKVKCIDEAGKESDEWHREVSIAAPYLDLIEEFSAEEHINFQRTFKKISKTNDELLREAGLAGAGQKEIRYYSSGMKQRLKLALAFFSDTSLLLLDEPHTNLDENGIDLYQQWIKSCSKNRLIIISSNEKQEYHFCSHVIAMNQLKEAGL